MGKNFSSEISKLEKEILRHKKLYYDGNPKISDTEYDLLEERLKSLDPDNYVLGLVGAQKAQNKIKHKQKMLSLMKTYDEESLKTWIGEHEVISTYKIDGVSCSLVYEQGKLVLAKTRGDGTFGADITQKVYWIESIPKRIAVQDLVEIRGELYCDEKGFFNLSAEMGKRDLERPSSQRNIVAGLVGRKDHIDLSSHLNFMGFDYIEFNRPSVNNEFEKFEKLQKLKFLRPVVEIHKNFKSVQSKLNEVKEFISEGDYGVDGVVFTYNDLSLHTELGHTAHHPRYKMVFKFKGDVKVTTIEEIIWSVSRNGILTPVASVKPVELGHAIISRVTLHNYGMVKSYNLKKGDQIEIIRSGEVIPKFLSVKKSSNNPLEIPMICPSCQKKVTIKDIRVLCSNELCPDKVKNDILNFIQKIGIENLSSRRLEEMMKADLIEDVADLYRVTKEDLIGLDKVQEKLAHKIFESIQSTKKVDLIVFLSALGLSGGAINKCQKVAEAGYNTLKKIQKITVEELKEVESFGKLSAKEFLKSLNSKKDLIEELLNLGFEIKDLPLARKSGAIAGKKICITGALSTKRSDIEKKIKNVGGTVVSSVSSKTDFLLTNETKSNSSKYKKAIELKIRIITEEEFYKLLN